MEYLKASGWKLDEKDKWGNTALHMSASKGFLKVVEYLLEAKLNPYQKNKEGLTPLDFAICEGHHDIESRFIKRRSEAASTNLHHAQQLLVSVKILIYLCKYCLFVYII